MFMPIPATAEQNLSFIQTYEAALWLTDYIGGSHRSPNHIHAGAITGQFIASHTNPNEQRFIFHDQVYNGQGAAYPVTQLDNPYTKEFLRMPHHIRNIVTMDLQCAPLYDVLHGAHKELCETAFKIATSEILDNDHAKSYHPKHTPFYDIVSLGFDMTRKAIALSYTPEQMYENSADLVEHSYYMQTVYAQTRKICTVLKSA